MKSSTLEPESVASLWQKWNSEFRLRPIRNDDELTAAMTVVKKLMQVSPRSPEEEDYFEILFQQIERYEAEFYPMPPPTEAGLLRHLIDSSRKTQVEVAKGSGIAESTLSALMSGTRKLTRNHIERLSKFFKLDPRVFYSLPTE